MLLERSKLSKCLINFIHSLGEITELLVCEMGKRIKLFLESGHLRIHFAYRLSTGTIIYQRVCLTVVVGVIHNVSEVVVWNQTVTGLNSIASK